MRIFITVAALSLTSISLARADSKKMPSPTYDVRSWPRMSADKFGCSLEKEFGYKDPKFNCSLTNYRNAGDPCKNTEAYYEGPAFPEKSVRKVHPHLKGIDLEWEHGLLRSVTFSFDRRIAENELRKSFGVPLGQTPPDNIQSLYVQDGSQNSLRLTLAGFEHQGAGDVDCGELK